MPSHQLILVNTASLANRRMIKKLYDREMSARTATNSKHDKRRDKIVAITQEQKKKLRSNVGAIRKLLVGRTGCYHAKPIKHFTVCEVLFLFTRFELTSNGKNQEMITCYVKPIIFERKRYRVQEEMTLAKAVTLAKSLTHCNKKKGARAYSDTFIKMDNKLVVLERLLTRGVRRGSEAVYDSAKVQNVDRRK